MTKVVDKYCWPVTQAVGWLCCGQSGATVLELGFQLDFFVYTYVVSHMCTEVQLREIWLAPYLPDLNCAWGGEGLFNVPIFFHHIYAAWTTWSLNTETSPNKEWLFISQHGIVSSEMWISICCYTQNCVTCYSELRKWCYRLTLDIGMPSVTFHWSVQPMNQCVFVSVQQHKLADNLRTFPDKDYSMAALWRNVTVMDAVNLLVDCTSNTCSLLEKTSCRFRRWWILFISILKK